MLERAFFETSPWVLGLATIALLALAAELGFRIGRRRSGAERGAQTTTAQAAILGLLGLLLAFSFSLSQARFDTRRQLVVEEANAIGTTYLRAQMLSAPHRDRTSELLREYAAARTPSPDARSVRRAIARSEELQDDLWSEARLVARSGASPATTLLFTESLNELIDLHTKRVAAYLYRAPAGLLVLLNVAAILALAVMGYGAGLEGRRTLFPTAAMILLVGVVLVLILDLEQTQRGMIRGSQQALLDVRAFIEREEARRPPQI